MNNQYEIELEGINDDIQSYYVDQAMNNGAGVFSAYLPYGIKCIDSEYCRRIQNINREVTMVIDIKRIPHYFGENGYRSDYWDEYHEKPLNKDFYSYNRSAFIYDKESPYIAVKITKNIQKYIDYNPEYPYQKKQLLTQEYTYTHPTYSAKHKGEDPEQLRKEIKENPHLHNKIKENLLGNLDNYLKK